MDGLLLRIAHDLLLDLGKNGLTVGRLRVKSVPRGRLGRRFSYASYTGAEFLSYFSDAVSHPRYLCAAGDFPVIECIETHNEANLGFHNSYKWYDLFGRKNVVQSRRYDGLRNSKYQLDVDRYLRWQGDRFAQYVADCNASIEARNSEYVDPCYVDAGYVTRYGPSTVEPFANDDTPVPPSFVCVGTDHMLLDGMSGNMSVTLYSTSGFVSWYDTNGTTRTEPEGVSFFLTSQTACVFPSDAAGVWDSSAQMHTLFISGDATTVDFSQLTNASQLDAILYNLAAPLVLPSAPSLVSASFQEYPYATIDLSPCPNLQSFSANTSQLQTLDLSVTPMIGQVIAQDAQLTQVAVDNIINTLYTNGQTNGVLWIDQGGSAAPSPASAVALAGLLANGWDVLTN